MGLWDRLLIVWQRLLIVVERVQLSYAAFFLKATNSYFLYLPLMAKLYIKCRKNDGYICGIASFERRGKRVKIVFTDCSGNNVSIYLVDYKVALKCTSNTKGYMGFIEYGHDFILGFKIKMDECFSHEVGYAPSGFKQFK